ncbi:MAG: ribonucleoside-diphosphate reductase, adenosylcobalamin-dependent [Candidatus Wildermuthbacteria bacterium RIFCSPLOWO2_01_FULL_48_29]|uniref:Vitamin B12-dependent ribonucleotide reductase n=2 Tax=Candidatus Wildermuthiibacteriota TaxID=1817923 RepID=A0A1G2RLR2_9BACT|nr:MAG: ribonucleoside-diphosphate reductase, adenosylcobalamin-dependent [Candidatus Wildermuthbacteria bacterium RIFCSPHIGHO2_01_FULL_48_27b]OHA73784.1 MAG: ribonucleoside-diphosphate reductase, adenosylcobalamin-dependent [Candidatus Wildermuthbacteria bacterium RIFCSPLOWO2_01_FULL_48_29]
MRVPQEVKDKVNGTFSENALKMMQKRYLVIDDEGNQETPADMFERVANSLAHVERSYGKDEEAEEQVAKDFFAIMASKEYTPAGRTLTNAGGETPLIANCIVLRIEDSMESIFQTLKEAALLQQAGCGLGFDLSEMRPANSPTKKSRGRASGPVTFLKVYDTAFGTIKQQGRHGANMAMIRVDHPDVLDFIECKTVEGEIRNFNISITVTDEFMRQLVENPNAQWYCQFNGKKMKPHKVFRHPNGTVYDAVEADMTVKELFDLLVEHAWLNGEPGIAFIDTINRTNPLPGLGPIAASNPCGEQYLHAYDNCNLGSINLAKFVVNKGIDWERLRFVTRTAARLMDNVIDKFDFPVPQVTELAQKNRRIGLGIMGFGDMLYQLGIRYDSAEGIHTAEKVMGFINEEAHKMSEELAREKGEFPNSDKSIFPVQGIKRRNAALTTVAPTGSISMMFDCSSGVEPNFALAYVKQDKDGQQYRYFNKYFQETLDRIEFTEAQQKEIMEKVMAEGSIQSIEWLSKELRDTFVVAMDISGRAHMEMQAAFQRHVDNSISKTINFPHSATKEDVGESFISAWKLGCKSATVYRDGSRSIQILNVGNGDNIVSTTEKPGTVPSTKVGTGVPTQDEGQASQTGLPAQAGVVPRKRPEVMMGKTYRMKTGYGNLYITINDDEAGKPFEIFATIGKSGGFFQEQSEAICRLSSLAMRAGIRVEEVIGDLKGIRGPMPIFTEKGTVLSLPDAIGRVLEEHVTGIRQIEDILERPEKQEVFAFAKEGDPSMADFGFMPGCPDCGAQLVMAEGCISCKGCGFSRCM